MAEEKRCMIHIEVDADDPESADAIARSLNVDNKASPRGVIASCAASGSRIICDVEISGCDDPRRVLTARNTADDLILDLRAAMSSLRALRGRAGPGANA